jgi:pyruvate formate lyase activating enzyme
LSLATAGCNFRCGFCQNWQISQLSRGDSTGQTRPGRAFSPGEIVDLARRQGCKSISYTYTEPTIFFELAYDTAKLAHQAGLRNCFVSNGFMTPQAIRTIAPYLDAINVDLKAFCDETYRKVFAGRLAPVLDSLVELRQAGIWLEVTTLVVPGMNDSPPELRKIAEFLATKLGLAVPWHLSRFHGDYKMSQSRSTPLDTLAGAMELGRRAGLKYVYCGNAPGQAGEQTRCPGCGEVLIDRLGFAVKTINLQQGSCPACSLAIEGVWQ